MTARQYHFLAGFSLGLIPYDIYTHSYSWIGYDIFVLIVCILASNKRIKEGKP